MVIELRTKTLKIHLWHLNKNYANLQTIKKKHILHNLYFRKLFLNHYKKTAEVKNNNVM